MPRPRLRSEPVASVPPDQHTHLQLIHDHQHGVLFQHNRRHKHDHIDIHRSLDRDQIPAAQPQMHDPAHPLTAVHIAGIAFGGALGVLLLGVFLWLPRRGTFGSGTLLGLKYGDVRHAGWRPDLGEGNVGAEMSQTGKGMRSAGDLRSPF
ncbi:hypothetical protein K466DRAFT_607601, partial [Polyporus arcularius HHB13444]